MRTCWKAQNARTWEEPCALPFQHPHFTDGETERPGEAYRGCSEKWAKSLVLELDIH